MLSCGAAFRCEWKLLAWLAKLDREVVGLSSSERLLGSIVRKDFGRFSLVSGFVSGFTFVAN